MELEISQPALGRPSNTAAAARTNGLPATVNWRHTLELWTFATLKVPLLMVARPRVRTVCSDRYELSLELARRTKNPFGSMYFGAMAIGAEATPMAHALVIARSLGRQVFFSTRQVKAEFLAAAKGEVTFRTDNGEQLRAAMVQAEEAKRSAVALVRVTALCAEQPVAVFDFELSVKPIGKTKAVPLAPFAQS
jgi:hypothetical protein